MLLKGQVGVVTGAAGGLGLATATRLAEHGARVVLSDVADEAGTAAAKALAERGFDARYVTCDVTDASAVDNLIAAVVEAYGRLDIAVANAGIVHVSDPLDLAETDFDRVLAVNLKGVFLTGQRAARQMRNQPPRETGARGTIINMSSVNAELVIPEIAPYVISKGGVQQWTRALAIRLATEGIRVNAIGPGSIATEMFKTVAASPEKYRGVLTRTPMGRAGRPEEIGDVAVFLASDLSTYITGQTIYADGGRLPLNYTVRAPDLLPEI